MTQNLHSLLLSRHALPFDRRVEFGVYNGWKAPMNRDEFDSVVATGLQILGHAPDCR
jgi:hypothetical protein